MSQRQTSLILAILCISFSGCHMLHKANDEVQRDWLGREVEIEYAVPSKVVAIWSNSVFNRVGQSPQRGLGGRIYFYDEGHQPIRVDGGLSVYVYDDTDAKPHSRLKQEATRVIHFDEKEVKANFAPTEFGASYSFWVPWDNVGGERKQLSIIPVFTDETGHMIVGEQARQLLPGKEPVEVTDENGDIVVQASHTTQYSERLDPNREPPESERRVTSSRIQLPETMQKRLSQPKPARKSWNINEWAKFENSRIRSSISPDANTKSVRHADHESANEAASQVTRAHETREAAQRKAAEMLAAKAAANASQEPKVQITADDIRQFMQKPAAMREKVEAGLPPKRVERQSMFPKRSDRNPLSSRKPLFSK